MVTGSNPDQHKIMLCETQLSILKTRGDIMDWYWLIIILIVIGIIRYEDVIWMVGEFIEYIKEAFDID